MSLRNLVRQQVANGFKAFGDIPRPADYYQMTGEVTRDLVAGTSVPVTNHYPLKGVIFAKFEEKENDKDVSRLTDEKAIFPALYLPITPSTSDTIVDENGVVWEVVDRLSDPASAVVVLHMRTSRTTT